MSGEFFIQGLKFAADANPDVSAGFEVKSSPRPYRIEFADGEDPAKNFLALVDAHKNPLVLVDGNILNRYFGGDPTSINAPVYVLQANEEAKTIETVLKVIDFMERENANKGTLLFVLGGGITQDVGAFSSAMYKRGLPWTFVPTTLLAQADSCLGAKAALNHKHTKNLLGLFCAPRKVIIDAGFLASLPKGDLLSGAGEIFRLCVTGGEDFLVGLERLVDAFLAGDPLAARELTALSLASKRAVVEYDEFELDIRRSMNYGHSFGHALEALCDYKIPHGVGISIGILVENEIATRRGMLPKDQRDRLMALGKKLISPDCLKVFKHTSMNGIIELFRRDKKTIGAVLKLATLQKIGDMRFIDFNLDDEGARELNAAVGVVLDDLGGGT